MERSELIAARTRRHWTQSELAEALGINRTTIQRWENGQSHPQPFHVRKLCEIFEMSIQELDLEEQQEMVEDKPNNLNHLDLTMRLIGIALSPYKSYQLVQSQIRQELGDAMNRREALQHLATFSALFLKSSVAPRHSKEVLSQCAAGITACWELSKSTDSTDIQLSFTGISAILDKLEITAKELPRYRPEALVLAAQCAMLKAVLGWHLQGTREAQIYAKQAIQYSQATEDFSLQVSAWKDLAWAYSYDPSEGRKALQAINQAALLARQHQVPVQLYATSLAYMQALNGQSNLVALREAEKAILHDGDGVDYDGTIYDCSIPQLTMNTAMVLYQQRDYSTAYQMTVDIIDLETLQLKKPLSERCRVELLNATATALLRQPQKDQDQVIHFWKAGIQGARSLHSEQRFREAVSSYSVMEALWDDKRVEGLRELTVHW